MYYLFSVYFSNKEIITVKSRSPEGVKVNE